MNTITSISNNNQFYLILGISLGVLLLFVFCYVVFTLIRRRDKTPKEHKESKVKEVRTKEPKIKEPKVKKKEVVVEEVQQFEIPNIYDLFGGKNNVVTYEQKGSRLILELNDVDVVNIEEIKKIGVEKILTMSKKVTLIGSGISNLLNNLKNF